MDYCSVYKRMPNIAGFCAFCEIHRDTFYAQKEYYSDTYKKVQDILEDGVLNSEVAPVIRIVYLKNKFGYVDKVENVTTVIEDTKFDLSKLTEDELKKFKELTLKAERSKDE